MLIHPTHNRPDRLGMGLWMDPCRRRLTTATPSTNSSSRICPPPTRREGRGATPPSPSANHGEAAPRDERHPRADPASSAGSYVHRAVTACGRWGCI
jgi:hypothetical protein